MVIKLAVIVTTILMKKNYFYEIVTGVPDEIPY